MSTTIHAPSWWRRHAAFYRASAALSFKRALQYRGAQFLGMFALLTEPVVYLVVWTTVADQQPDGTLNGLTAGQVAGYYVVWTLVRNLTGSFFPVVWEQRLRDGSLADWLLRPIHPVHDDLAGMFTVNLLRVALAIPITAGLVLAFRPDLSLGPAELGVCTFSVAVAYVLRALIFASIGTIGFWTIRVDAATRLYLAVELLLSGRLVPVVLFPAWLASTAEWLPLRYTFGFPIEVLSTPMSSGELARGLTLQVGWLAAISVAFAALWRMSVSRFESAGI